MSFTICPMFRHSIFGTFLDETTSRVGWRRKISATERKRQQPVGGVLLQLSKLEKVQTWRWHRCPVCKLFFGCFWTGAFGFLSRMYFVEDLQRVDFVRSPGPHLCFTFAAYSSTHIRSKLVLKASERYVGHCETSGDKNSQCFCASFGGVKVGLVFSISKRSFKLLPSTWYGEVGDTDGFMTFIHSFNFHLSIYVFMYVHIYLFIYVLICLFIRSSIHIYI